MKKLISGLMSACIAVSSAIALTTSSAFNPNKDPNGDGSLTLADSTAILQYLGGYYEPSDLTELDVDDNYVVSVVDSNYVKMYDAGIINSDNYIEPAEANPAASSRTYEVYNAQNATYLRSYTLQLQQNSNSYNLQSSNTDDNDYLYDPSTQVEDWSNKGVAKIFFINDDNEKAPTGTGFVVGPHTIATAAHVVYENNNDYAYKIPEILLFNENGTQYSITPVECHFPSSYRIANGQSNTDDYALITVEENLSNYMTFNLGAPTNFASTSSLPIKIVGFPGRYDGLDENTTINTNTEHVKMLSEGVLLLNETSTTFLYTNILHNAYAGGGYSGSPIYTTETQNGTTYNTVIGIHIARGNVGLRFTSHVLKFYNSNPNIQY